MRIILTPVSFLFLAFFLACSVYSEEAKTYPLTASQQKWLNEVHWIISDYERNAFLSLQSEQDRNQFIESFWQDRDPTPGTKENEFKDEHYKRFEYANKFYGRDTSQPGWKTDRGRIYILLGKPESTDRAPERFEFYPMELWHYVGYEGYGLPSSLYLLFFQDRGIGPLRLYSPLSDGINKLYNSRQFEMAKRVEENLYDYMRHNLSPEFAQAAISFIPTEFGVQGFDGLQASVSTEIVMSKIQNARNYEANKRTYVEDILQGRPTVKVYYSINNEGIRDGLYWFQAPTGNFYLEYAVEYEPRKLDMGQYEDEYYTSLTLDGQIVVDPKTVVDEIAGSHEIKLNKEQLVKVGSIPFQYQGIKPITSGKFGVTLILTNNVSRQAATFTYNIEIPNMMAYDKPYLPPLLPVLSVEKVKTPDPNRLRPFQFGENVYIPNIRAKYPQTGSLQTYHQVIFNEGFIGGVGSLALRYVIQNEDKVEREVVDPIDLPASQLAGNAIEIKKDIPLSGLALGRKQLLVQLTQDQKVIAVSPPMNFSVESEASPAVWKFSAGLPGLDSDYHNYTLAMQLLRMNKTDQAISLMESALKQNPNSLEIRLELMRLTLRSKNYANVIQLGSPAEVENPNNPQLLWFMGWAYYGLGKYEDTIRFFERLRFVDPKKVEVLNLLADVYFRLDQPVKSLERIQESLALKPDQNDILELKKKVEESEKY